MDYWERTRREINAFVPFSYYHSMGLVRCGQRLYKIGGKELNDILCREINNARLVHVSNGYEFQGNWVRTITINEMVYHNRTRWGLPDYFNAIMISTISRTHVVSFNDLSETIKLRRVQRAVRAWIKRKMILAFLMAFHARLGAGSLAGEVLNEDMAQKICDVY